MTRKTYPDDAHKATIITRQIGDGTINPKATMVVGLVLDDDPVYLAGGTELVIPVGPDDLATLKLELFIGEFEFVDEFEFEHGDDPDKDLLPRRGEARCKALLGDGPERCEYRDGHDGSHRFDVADHPVGETARSLLAEYEAKHGEITDDEMAELESDDEMASDAEWAALPGKIEAQRAALDVWHEIVRIGVPTVDGRVLERVEFHPERHPIKVSDHTGVWGEITDLRHQVVDGVPTVDVKVDRALPAGMVLVPDVRAIDQWSDHGDFVHIEGEIVGLTLVPEADWPWSRVRGPRAGVDANRNTHGTFLEPLTQIARSIRTAQNIAHEAIGHEGEPRLCKRSLCDRLIRDGADIEEHARRQENQNATE